MLAARCNNANYPCFLLGSFTRESESGAASEIAGERRSFTEADNSSTVLLNETVESFSRSCWSFPSYFFSNLDTSPAFLRLVFSCPLVDLLRIMRKAISLSDPSVSFPVLGHFRGELRLRGGARWGLANYPSRMGKSTPRPSAKNHNAGAGVPTGRMRRSSWAAVRGLRSNRRV
jgi:hypothetical protein